MKIIIVEDDKVLREELNNLLKNAGYETVVLNNFENSFEEILDSVADLILLDINIPFLNGETLLKKFVSIVIFP